MSKIAILMSTYNGEKYIEQQLSSIYGQVCKHDISLYIRDDGSTDNTIKIINSWKDRLNICIEQGDNIGPARSFWILLTDRSIKADYYAFCDQDDIWDADKLEIAVSRLEKDFHLYACNCRSIDSIGNIIEDVRKKRTPELRIDTFFVSGFTQGCAMVFTDALREYVIEKDVKYITMHDVVLCMYAIIYGKIYWDVTPHFSYRFHNSNVVANKSRKGIGGKFRTVSRWKKNSSTSLTDVASELLSNTVVDDPTQNRFIREMSRAKKSVGSKIYLLKYKEIKDLDKNSLYSFYCRILLNLI